MKKIILSLSMIAVVAVVVAGATGAFFSDTETSTGNTFTAGAIDLTVDSEQHYNDMVCVWDGDLTNGDQTQGAWVWDGPDGSYPERGTYCDGSWEAADLGGQKFFNFNDIKPGDEGENTISLHINNNDAWLRMIIKDVTDFDNTCTEPEEGSSDVCTVVSPELLTPGAGELREALLFSIWLDQGETPGFQNNGDEGEGDNIQQCEYENGDEPNDCYEPTLISAGTINSLGETWPLPTPLLGGQTAYFGVAWSLPSGTGNETQTDSMSATMEFQVVQSRNNPNPWPLTPSTP